MAADRSTLPAVGVDPAFAFPAIHRHTLPNGLSVRTVEHHAAPVVTFVALVEGGVGADPAGREGLSGLTADMVDEGTGSLSAIDVSDAIVRIGGEYDVEVAPDVTLFTLMTLSRFAHRGADLLSSIMTRPTLRESDFDRVRQLRLDRLRQLKDLPPAMAERALLRTLYDHHPYGHLAIGTDEALRGLLLDDVAAFHRAAYRPSSTTVVAAGPLSHDQLLQITESAFGEWNGADGPTPRAASSMEPPAAAPGLLAIVPRPGSAQSELRIAHLAARRDTPDYPALVVMNAVLGGQFVSRINLKLREEKGYTYGARTGFDWRRGLGPFVLQASVHTAATADAVRESLSELDAIRGTRPPSDGELTLAKASLTRGFPRNFETVQQVARSVAQLAIFELPDDYFERFVPRIDAVTAADVTAAARRYIEPGRLATLIVGDHAAIGDSLLELGFGPPTILPPDV
jgi:predicted Zn-dependent peptidase